MSELKALDALRGWVDHIDENGHLGRLSDFGKQGLRVIADAIEAELSERYMELPLDAEGVPIHVGDTVEFGENRNQGIVKALNERMVISMHVDDDYTNYAKYGLLWNADACRHVKLRTIEDVLGEYALKMNDAYNDPYIGWEDRADVLSMITDDYAAELRELMGGGE